MTRGQRVIGGERGIALLSILGILAVLIVLATLVAGSARTESALTGVTKQSARAFSHADAGLAFAIGDVDNFVNDLTFTCRPVYNPRHTDLEAAGVQIAGDVDVCFDFQGPPPVSVKVSALRFRAFHFNMAATGTAPPNATSNLEMEAARLGPAA